MCKNDRQGGGAEELGDGGETAPDGAVFEGFGEVAAVSGEDGKDGEDGCDALGHRLPGAIRWGIGQRGKAGREGRRGAHASYYCKLTGPVKKFFRSMGPGNRSQRSPLAATKQ